MELVNASTLSEQGRAVRLSEMLEMEDLSQGTGRVGSAEVGLPEWGQTGSSRAGHATDLIVLERKTGLPDSRGSYGFVSRVLDVLIVDSVFLTGHLTGRIESLLAFLLMLLITGVVNHV